MKLSLSQENLVFCEKFHEAERTKIQRKDLRIVEAFAEEDDLGDKRRVGHDHRDGPKHGLEVVGQFRSSGVSGVHGDEDATRPLESDVATLEDKARHGVGQGRHDAEDLLCYHRQHLDVDPVELVETAPRTRLTPQQQQQVLKVI